MSLTIAEQITKDIADTRQSIESTIMDINDTCNIVKRGEMTMSEFINHLDESSADLKRYMVTLADLAIWRDLK